MLQTKTINKFLKEKLNELGNVFTPNYTFNTYTESGEIGSMMNPRSIQGRLKRDMASTSPMVGHTESTFSYILELRVPCRQAVNEHIINVTALFDSLLTQINGTYENMDGGRGLFTIDGGIVQGGLVDNHVTLAVRFNVKWSPDIAESTEPITKDQIEIKLMKRIPYHNRTIDMNEPDVEVLKLNSTVIGWSHDGVSSILKMKLPAAFNGEYNYVQVTEFNGRATRWFVLQRDFTEPDVWIHHLRRDLVRENWEKLVESPMYIEKAIVPNDSPLILNKEQIEVNQIKSKEILLNEQNCEWAYLYVEPKHNFTATYIASTSYDIDLGNTDNELFNKLLLSSKIEVVDKNTASLRFYARAEGSSYNTKYTRYEYYATSGEFISNPGSSYGDPCYWQTRTNTSLETINNMCRSWFSQINLSSYYDTGDEAMIMRWSSKKIKYKNVIYQITNNGYTIHDGYGFNSSYKRIDTPATDWNLFRNAWLSNGLTTTSGSLLRFIDLVSTTKVYSFTVQTIPTDDKSVSFTVEQIHGLPYGIIAIPWDEYDGLREIGEDENGNAITESIKTDAAVNRAIIGELLLNDGDGDSQFIFDAQKLPYSPFWNDENAILTKSESTDFYYKILSDDIVKKALNVKDENGAKWHYTVTDPKIENQCDMWRIVSPNGSDTYEFSMVKNKGLSGFQLDMRLKPGKPFIMISPNWDGYYGLDFDDYRGLVLSGDFSFPRATSAWLEYIVNNKNYQLIQNRQVENMETNNAISNMMQKSNTDFQRNMGLMNSAIALLGGGIAGSPMSIMGGTMGGLTTELSYGQQMRNLSFNRQLQQEALDYAHDMFNYNLQNIKAQPIQIQKIDAFDANYKRFPFLEYYTCTDEEKEIVRNKIKFNGMTVMAMGKMNDYLSDELQYIKGKLVAVDSNISTNEFNALSEEMNKGIFTKSVAQMETG